MVFKVSVHDKYGIRVTKILPVVNSYGQTSFDFLEESEIRMTELEVEKYLESKDFGS